jgi:hypothetical protein
MLPKDLKPKAPNPFYPILYSTLLDWLIVGHKTNTGVYLLIIGQKNNNGVRPTTE